MPPKARNACLRVSPHRDRATEDGRRAASPQVSSEILTGADNYTASTHRGNLRLWLAYGFVSVGRHRQPDPWLAKRRDATPRHGYTAPPPHTTPCALATHDADGRRSSSKNTRATPNKTTREECGPRFTLSTRLAVQTEE